MADASNDEGGDVGSHLDQRTRLMQEVAEQMDAIESDFGDDFTIGRVITIVEVQQADGQVGLRVRAGQFPWVAIGMLDWAKKSLEEAHRATTD